MQRNNGNGFDPAIWWGGVSNQTSFGVAWNAPRGVATPTATVADLIDMNADGWPDRVMRNRVAPYDHFVVQLSNGAGSFGAAQNWSPLNQYAGTFASDWGSPNAGDQVYATLADLDGDGKPDRVLRNATARYDTFYVQRNIGNGFDPYWRLWQPVTAQSQNGSNWGAIAGQLTSSDSTASYKSSISDLIDMNADGLPDRLMRRFASPYSTGFIIQYNLGSSWGSEEPFGGLSPLVNQGYADFFNNSLNSTITTTAGTAGNQTLVDLNGDGFPDRVLRKALAASLASIRPARGAG